MSTPIPAAPTRVSTVFDLARMFDTLDHKAILENLARRSPDQFVSLVHAWVEHTCPVPAPLQRLLEHLANDRQVSAIKELRQYWLDKFAVSLGLLEAKIACDVLRRQRTMADANADYNLGTMNIVRQVLTHLAGQGIALDVVAAERDRIGTKQAA